MSDPPATISIRRMESRDIAWVRALADSLPEAPHWPGAVYQGAIDPQAAPRRIALVAVSLEAGAGTGFAIARLLPPEAELETIAVARGSQRQGIGRRLFAALAAELEAWNVTEVVLEVRASNLPAIGLYRKLGFLETGLRKGYYVDPTEDAVLMSLRLN